MEQIIGHACACLLGTPFHRYGKGIMLEGSEITPKPYFNDKVVQFKLLEDLSNNPDTLCIRNHWVILPSNVKVLGGMGGG